MSSSKLISKDLEDSLGVVSPDMLKVYKQWLDLLVDVEIKD